MKLGCTVGCKDIEKIELAAKVGFDYVEVALNGLAACSEEDFESFKAAVKKNNIPCEAANCLFPKTIKLCDKIYDGAAVEAYLETAFSKAKELGVEVVVFGSGASRKISDDVDREKAIEQLRLTCIEYLNPIAVRYGITVVIEPLNKGETNIFNSLEETYAFLSELGLSNVKCLADTYHMDLESEPYSNVNLAGNDLRHTHIANPDGRVMPLEMDKNDYKPFFSALREISYSGRLSIEAGVPAGMTLEEALAESLRFLRSIT